MWGIVKIRVSLEIWCGSQVPRQERVRFTKQNILEKQEKKNSKLVFTPGLLLNCEVINK